jgi:hypothetical protein
MSAQERIHQIELVFRRSRIYYCISSAVMISFPLVLVYAIYQAVRFIITTNHAALHFALSALLLALLIDCAGRLILTPIWHRSSAEVELELEKAEEELRRPGSSPLGRAPSL